LAEHRIIFNRVTGGTNKGFHDGYDECTECKELQLTILHQIIQGAAKKVDP